MDVLWWFYTVILGAAFTQVSIAIAVQWKTSSATGERLHLPTLLWQIFLIILTVQVWVAVSVYLRTVESMSVLSLLAFLWVPMGLLILSIFLADQWWNGRSTDDDEQRFNALRRPFFVVLILIPVINLVHEIAMGSAGFDDDTLFPLAIAIGGVIGLRLRSVRADSILAAAEILLVLVYLFAFYGSVSIT